MAITSKGGAKKNASSFAYSCQETRIKTDMEAVSRYIKVAQI